LTLFTSTIDRATRLVPIADDRVRLVNVAGGTKVRGSELLLRYRRAPFTLTGSYVHMDASERYDPLLLPQRLLDGRWTVDVWAPTVGFILNAGLRLRFGEED
jgi:outer membrane receptor protein involved in Fe transport